jgi:hypothetical protein
MIPAAIAIFMIGCGGGGGSSTPTNPTPTPQANRNPTISSVTVTPTFGVQDFGQFTFNAAASDADNDSLTYTWDLAGNPRVGQTAQIGPFVNGGDFTGNVTVTDGKGGTASNSVQFIVGTMTGTWRGGVFNTTALPSFQMTLTQAAGLFSGSITTGIGNGQVGPTGALATINGSGLVTMRIKVAPFTDFTMTGQMDTTGRRVTGSVSGSGFTGQPFIIDKQ